jgi:hypothetical protein
MADCVLGVLIVWCTVLSLFVFNGLMVVFGLREEVKDLEEEIKRLKEIK